MADPDVRKLARVHTEEAVNTLAEVMRSRKAPFHSRIVAASMLLDRGYGKPAQSQLAAELPGGALDQLTIDELYRLKERIADDLRSGDNSTQGEGKLN